MSALTKIEELRRRVQLNPASIAFAALAEEYRRAGRFDDAITTCLAGLTRHPAYTSARVTLGRALLQSGRVDEARTELEAALRVAPENLAAIRALAEIHETGQLAAGAERLTGETGGLDMAPAAIAPLDTAAGEGDGLPPVLRSSAPELARPADRPEELQLQALGTWLSAIERLRDAHEVHRQA